MISDDQMLASVVLVYVLLYALMWRRRAKDAERELARVNKAASEVWYEKHFGETARKEQWPRCERGDQ